MQVMVRTRQVSIIQTMLAVLAFSFFQALAAQVKLPLFFTPVPVTMQTLVVMLGIVMLKERAVLTQAVYITLGVLGAPFFSGGAGTACLLGPTGGYILGFFAASLIAPCLLSGRRDKGTSFVFVSVVLSLALAMIYLCGITWLKVFMGISLSSAVMLGVVPFIPGALFKLAVASSIGVYYLNRK